MNKQVIDILSRQTPPQEITDLRQRCQGLVRMSRSAMKNYYPMWDQNDQVYRGERHIDESDRKAQKKGEPAKVFVPLTHSQVQTFVSFGTTLLTQRDYFYELAGRGVEDEKPAKLGQACVQRDLEYNAFQGILLPQWLTDVARFGLAIFKSDWVRVTVPVLKQVPDPKFQQNPMLPQVQPPTISKYVPTTKYLGNNITVVSPYRWFPDTRLPLTRYRYGEFCADENEYSFQELQRMELDGRCAGVAEIPRLADDSFEERRLNSITRENNSLIDPTSTNKIQYCLITEVELKLNPSKTLIDKDVFLDKDLDADVICIIWIANDGRIIRIEDSGYNHNEFLFDAAQFFNDQNRMINFGLAELVGPMQDILDWLMNSHVANVRKVIQNQLIVDPKYIDMADLEERRPVIRLKSSMVEGMAITNFVHQLQVVDATAGHVNDMGIIKGFSQDATGLSDNLLGQYASGRRSAREASNVNANAAARVVVPMKGLWEGALLPLGRKLLSNLQQGLDEQQLVSVIGVQRFLSDPETIRAFLPIDRSMLVGTYDFLVFDATLPSQRYAIAQVLAAAGDTLMKNPRAIFALGIDPKIIFEEWLQLNGVRNVEKFYLTPKRFAELAAMAGVAPNQGVPTGAPGQGGNGPVNGASQPAGVQQRPGQR